MQLDGITLTELNRLYEEDPKLFTQAVDLINTGTASLSGAPMEMPEQNDSAAEQLAEICGRTGMDPHADTCNFRGSVKNQVVVYNAIYSKYGPKMADLYKPAVNVRPRTKWLQEGFIVREGQQPLCIIKNYRDGQEWDLELWHQVQVEPK